MSHERYPTEGERLYRQETKKLPTETGNQLVAALLRKPEVASWLPVYFSQEFIQEAHEYGLLHEWVAAVCRWISSTPQEEVAAFLDEQASTSQSFEHTFFTIFAQVDSRVQTFFFDQSGEPRARIEVFSRMVSVDQRPGFIRGLQIEPECFSAFSIEQLVAFNMDYRKISEVYILKSEYPEGYAWVTANEQDFDLFPALVRKYSKQTLEAVTAAANSTKLLDFRNTYTFAQLHVFFVDSHEYLISFLRKVSDFPEFLEVAPLLTAPVVDFLKRIWIRGSEFNDFVLQENVSTVFNVVSYITTSVPKKTVAWLIDDVFCTSYGHSKFRTFQLLSSPTFFEWVTSTDVGAKVLTGVGRSVSDARVLSLCEEFETGPLYAELFATRTVAELADIFNNWSFSKGGGDFLIELQSLYTELPDYIKYLDRDTIDALDNLCMSNNQVRMMYQLESPEAMEVYKYLHGEPSLLSEFGVDQNIRARSFEALLYTVKLLSQSRFLEWIDGLNPFYTAVEVANSAALDSSEPEQLLNYLADDSTYEKILTTVPAREYLLVLRTSLSFVKNWKVILENPAFFDLAYDLHSNHESQHTLDWGHRLMMLRATVESLGLVSDTGLVEELLFDIWPGEQIEVYEIAQILVEKGVIKSEAEFAIKEQYHDLSRFGQIIVLESLWNGTPFAELKQLYLLARQKEIRDELYWIVIFEEWGFSSDADVQEVAAHAGLEHIRTLQDLATLSKDDAYSFAAFLLSHFGSEEKYLMAMQAIERVREKVLSDPLHFSQIEHPLHPLRPYVASLGWEIEHPVPRYLDGLAGKGKGVELYRWLDYFGFRRGNDLPNEFAPGPFYRSETIQKTNELWNRVGLIPFNEMMTATLHTNAGVSNQWLYSRVMRLLHSTGFAFYTEKSELYGHNFMYSKDEGMGKFLESKQGAVVTKEGLEEHLLGAKALVDALHAYETIMDEYGMLPERNSDYPQVELTGEMILDSSVAEVTKQLALVWQETYQRFDEVITQLITVKPGQHAMAGLTSLNQDDVVIRKWLTQFHGVFKSLEDYYDPSIEEKTTTPVAVADQLFANMVAACRWIVRDARVQVEQILRQADQELWAQQLDLLTRIASVKTKSWRQTLMARFFEEYPYVFDQVRQIVGVDLTGSDREIEVMVIRELCAYYSIELLW